MKSTDAREFLVNIPSLKNGSHEFHYEIKDAFFEDFGSELVEKGSGGCELQLKKSETMMQMTFELDLVVELVCDRSLEPFPFEIKKKQDLIVKFGAEDEELSEDLIVINHDTQMLEVGPFINEIIGLNIPMKKLHPKYEGQETPDLIYRTETDENIKEETDPRWEELKKLSNN